MASDIPPLELRIRGFFNDLGRERIQELLAEFYDRTGIEHHSTLEKGIFLAQSPDAFNHPREDGLELTELEKKAVCLDSIQEKRFFFHEQGDAMHQRKNNYWGKWSGLPWPLWKLIVLCAIGAAVQGWDEAAINAAQPFYPKALNVPIYLPNPNIPSDHPAFHTTQIFGLINSAPYLSSAFSSWLAPWLNDRLGRRGTIFWCALFSATFAFAQAFVRTWQELLVFRLLMGLGIGLKSATIPIYAAECAPANIRGSMVMFWQMWTAFGIMAGAISGYILYDKAEGYGTLTCPIDDNVTTSSIVRLQLLSWQCSANWRLILASPCILPMILAAYIYGCHESPRWTIKNAHHLRSIGRNRRASYFYQRAFRALQDLCRDPLLAARDMTSEYFLLEEERKGLIERQELNPARSQILHDFHELFREKRNARALMASTVCMFAQQFCGINVIIYYSNIIFQTASGTPEFGKTYLYTTGIGIINLVLAIPAFFTIDTVGRRTLLLTTFPCLALSHVITAIGLGKAVQSTAVTVVGMCMFTVFYSIGEGPVPFVYASESMPLHIREKGMALVTSINWFWSWFIAFTGPEFFVKFKPSGTFMWYAVWCIILWFAVLFWVPETRQLTLEELDFVFTYIEARDLASHAWKTFLAFISLGETPPGVYEIKQPADEEQPSPDDDQPDRRRTLLDTHESHNTSGTEVQVEHIEEKIA